GGTARHDGDPNTAPAAPTCGDESVTIAKPSPAIPTAPAVSGTGTVGATTVKDTATLTGSYNATGTIEFTLYGPSATADCITTPVDDQNVTVTDDASYKSPAVPP